MREAGEVRDARFASTQPFWCNDSFKQAVNYGWKPLASRLSLKRVRRTGSGRTTVFLHAFCGVFGDNPIISLLEQRVN